MNKLFFFSLLFLLFSCKAKVPEEVINRSTMEDLLYDYHLAQAMAKSKSDSIDYCLRLYTQAVFDKYGVSEEKFNHSMEWYTRNSEELFKIYKQIDQRFAEAGSTVKVQGNRYATMTAPGDTMNIWQGRDFYLLTSAGTNRLAFSQVADTTFSKGDRFMWQFETQWYYREGQKSAIAQLALVYDNDSVASTMQTLYSAGKQELFINASDRPVKLVQGFIYLNMPWTELPRIMTITNPVLVKFKRQKPLKMKEVVAERTNSSEEQSGMKANDSLKIERKDTIQQKRHGRDRIETFKKTDLQMSEPTRLLQLPK